MLNQSTTENPSILEPQPQGVPIGRRPADTDETPFDGGGGAVGDMGSSPDREGGDLSASIIDAPRTRAEISRANSLRSTGPRTPEGKAIASANSFKHGLCAQTFILPPDEQQAFIHYSRDLARDLRVEGQLEMSLVQNMADAQFQIERASAIENNILQLGALEHTDAADPTRDFALDHTTGLVITLKENIKTIDLISRYAARHNRAFLQNHARLREVQKDRRNGAPVNNPNAAEPTPNQSHEKNPGFVPQPSSTVLQACENPPHRTNPNRGERPNRSPGAKNHPGVS